LHEFGEDHLQNVLALLRRTVDGNRERGVLVLALRSGTGTCSATNAVAFYELRREVDREILRVNPKLLVWVTTLLRAVVARFVFESLELTNVFDVNAVRAFIACSQGNLARMNFFVSQCDQRAQATCCRGSTPNPLLELL
jgi:hypothetical protein